MNEDPLAVNVCPGCGATDCTPATCPAYVDWHPTPAPVLSNGETPRHNPAGGSPRVPQKDVP